MENSVDVFKPLLEKGAEYYKCVAHLHFRGASDVIEECKPLVEDLKVKGKVFAELCDYVHSVCGAEHIIEQDKFLEQIGLLFENKLMS